MKLTPLYDRVIVRNIEDSARTKAGLYVPDIARGNVPYARGEVVAVGAGRVAMDGTVAPLTVKVGDAVIYDRKAGVDMPLDDEEVVLLREPEIIAILTELPRATGLYDAEGKDATLQ
jgi:chaperonin GroES